MFHRIIYDYVAKIKLTYPGKATITKYCLPGARKEETIDAEQRTQEHSCCIEVSFCHITKSLNVCFQISDITFL